MKIIIRTAEVGLLVTHWVCSVKDGCSSPLRAAYYNSSRNKKDQ